MKITARRVIGEIGLKVVELAVSFTAGFVFNHYQHDAAPGIEWVIGAAVFLMMQMLELIVRSDRHAEEQQSLVSALARTLAKEDIKRVLLQIGIAHAGRALTESETNAAWRELTWFTQHEYLATNFINPGPFYDSGHAQNVLQLQKAKLRAQERFSVRKVLIWKDADERNSDKAKAVVGLHLDDPRALMDLHGILRDEIDQRSSLKDDLANDLDDQIDFAVFDRSVVLLWKLDAARKVVGGSVLVSEAEVAKFCAFFDQLVSEAPPLKV